MSADNQEEVARLKSRIQEMLKKVPPSIAAAGIKTTRSYMDSVKKAQKVLGSNRATLLNVQTAYTALSVHWNNS